MFSRLSRSAPHPARQGGPPFTTHSGGDKDLCGNSTIPFTPREKTPGVKGTVLVKSMGEGLAERTSVLLPIVVCVGY